MKTMGILLIFTILSVVIGFERCKNIKINTARAYSHEISYAIGTCVSKQRYSNGRNYEEECCLEPGFYKLDCNDYLGDGWNGGYLEIDGDRYCDTFYGYKLVVPVEWTAA